MKPVLLMKTGAALPEMVPAHGDFEDWFAVGMSGTRWHQSDVFKGQVLPALNELAGVVITGSAAMVSHREDWSEAAAEWVLGAVKAGLPVLGVCYGHQLLAHALGGRVGPNPKGREVGTQNVTLTEAAAKDTLFAATPRSHTAQTIHLETILELPKGAVRLASSELDENMVVQFGSNAWGVQYHPEFSAEVVRDYIRRRAGMLREEGLEPEVLLANVRETPHAAAVLPAFRDRFLAAAAA